MANTIKLRRSATSGAIPTASQLALGELAMNTFDGKLFIKTDQSGTESVVEIGASAGSGSTVTIASTPPSSPNAGDIYWDDVDGAAYIYYNDGDTQQWVSLTPATPAASQTAAQLLTSIKTVDGTGSGLDADLLDGQHGVYYTGYTDTAIANLVDSAPATLDTLNELAAALGDDANFSTTVTNSIATKLPLAGGTLTGSVTVSSSNNPLELTRNAGASSGTLLSRFNNNSARVIDFFTDGSSLFTGNVTAASSGAFSGSAGILLRSDTNQIFINGTADSASALDIKGNAIIKGDGSATFGSGAVELAPNSGITIDDGAIDLYLATSNGNAKPFKVQTDVGGTKVEKASISANGNASFSGTVTANAFSGDGSALTNLPAAGVSLGLAIALG